MHDLGEHAGDVLLGFLLGRLASPLPQEFAGLVEHRDAPVAVAVGDVDVAVARIDHDPRRHVELVLRGVVALAAPRAVDRVEFALGADLQQQLAVRRVFLDDAVGIAGDIDILVAVDEAAVDRVGHRVLVAPGADDVALHVELDDRRRGDRGFLLLVGDVAPVDHVDVVLLGRADAAELAGDPVLRQFLGPAGIDCEFAARSGRCAGTRPSASGSAAAETASRMKLLMVSLPASDVSLLEFLAAEIDGLDTAHVGDVVERIVG